MNIDITWQGGLALALLISSGNALANLPDSEDGGDLTPPHVQHLTDTERMLIEAQVLKSVDSLVQGGAMLPSGNAVPPPKFIWPVRPAVGVEDFNVDAISNYVDQDVNNPNSLLDYYCGTRTYDLTGYNHAGIDIFSWPFSRLKQLNDEVEIIAAAAGTIVYKSDGNDDQSCGFGGGNWNAVYVSHADGSVAWYGHMKKNSLTSKNVGESVAAGEFLGVMGSSGNSTGPHLHMEVYDASNNLIDPYAGACNLLNTESWWENQDPYYLPQVNALGTGFAYPQFNSCPQTETTNLTNTFMYGDPLTLTAYYRDQLNTLPSTYTIYQPDGGQFTTWNHTGSAAHYAASWWGWGYNNFYVTDTGIWKFAVDFNSVEYEKEFYLVDSCATNAVVPAQQLTSVITYGASDTVTTQTNNIDVEAGARMTLLAEDMITLGDGFTVAAAGQLTMKNVAVCN